MLLDELYYFPQLGVRIGEAALHGIYYDESEYDYMQHLKPMGAPGAIFIEAGSTDKQKEKEKAAMDKVLQFRDETPKVIKELHLQIVYTINLVQSVKKRKTRRTKKKSIQWTISSKYVNLIPKC
jgi:hypothetical protein